MSECLLSESVVALAQDMNILSIDKCQKLIYILHVIEGLLKLSPLAVNKKPREWCQVKQG
jgi:hypothetical protein